jgi:hypothetical protein
MSFSVSYSGGGLIARRRRHPMRSLDLHGLTFPATTNEVWTSKIAFTHYNTKIYSNFNYLDMHSNNLCPHTSCI